MKSTRQDLMPLVSADEIGANLTGKILNVHRLVANSPELLNASAALRNYLVKESVLSERVRELLICRIGARLASEYEWAHHVVRGQAAGLTLEEIEKTRFDIDPAEWRAEEAIVLRLVDETLDQQLLKEETAASAIDLLGKAGVIDAVFTIGYYLTLGTLLKSFDVPLESEIKPL